MRQSIFPQTRNVIETILVLLLLLALLFALYDTLKVFFGVFTFALIFYVSFERPYARLVRCTTGGSWLPPSIPLCCFCW